MLPWHSLTGIYNQREHAAWSAVQFVSTRVFNTLKYILAARLLGPELFGKAGIVLVVLAATEALTDLGLSQSIVTSKHDLSREQYVSLWTLTQLRSLALCGLLVLLGLLSPIIYPDPAIRTMVLLCSVLPIIRNLPSIDLAIRQRACDFRINAVLLGSSALVDVAVSVILITLTHNPSGIFIGVIAGELVKLILAVFLLRIRPVWSLQMAEITEHNRYGRWIWGSSVLGFLLNQFDKIFLSFSVTSGAFGLYQMGGRLSQLATSEPFTAAGQYLFPRISQEVRRGGDAGWRFYNRLFRIHLLILTSLLGLIFLFVRPLVGLVLGREWQAAVPFILILSVASGIGAFINLMVMYVRSIGFPGWVTGATVVQMVVYIPSVIGLFHVAGTLGIAYASVVGVTSTFLVLSWNIFSYHRRAKP